MLVRHRVIFSVLAGLALAASTLSPAQAATNGASDPRGDAPARIDVSHVKYGNLKHRLTALVRIPGLHRSGEVDVYLSAGGSGETRLARVFIKKNHKVGKRFYLAGDQVTRKRCAFSATWKAGKNRVFLSVPKRCMGGVSTTTVTFQTSTFGANGANDNVNLVTVSRM